MTLGSEKGGREVPRGIMDEGVKDMHYNFDSIRPLSSSKIEGWNDFARGFF